MVIQRRGRLRIRPREGSCVTGRGRRDIRPSEWEAEVRDRLVAGDEAALGEVYDQFSSFVHGLSLRIAVSLEKEGAGAWV